MIYSLQTQLGSWVGEIKVGWEALSMGKVRELVVQVEGDRDRGTNEESRQRGGA